jgi:hypothetical protein
MPCPLAVIGEVCQGISQLSCPRARSGRSRPGKALSRAASSLAGRRWLATGIEEMRVP